MASKHPPEGLAEPPHGVLISNINYFSIAFFVCKNMLLGVPRGPLEGPWGASEGPWRASGRPFWPLARPIWPRPRLGHWPFVDFEAGQLALESHLLQIVFLTGESKLVKVKPWRLDLVD